MNSVILIISTERSLEDLRGRLSPDWDAQIANDNRIIIMHGNYHALVVSDSSIQQDFEDYELTKIRSLISKPMFYLFTFNNFEFGKEVLRYIADYDDTAIDNDRGNIFAGKDFAKALQNEPDWDWR